MGGPKKIRPKKLSAIREAFCQHYTKHWNATRAAKESGYKARWAADIGHRLTNNSLVKARISELTEHALKEIGVTRERVLTELSRIAFANMKDVASWNPSGVEYKSSEEISESDAAAISEVTETVTQAGGTLKIKQHDKTRALEILSKHLKMLTDKHEHSGPDGKPIEHKNVSQLPDDELDANIKALLLKAEDA